VHIEYPNLFYWAIFFRICLFFLFFLLDVKLDNMKIDNLFSVVRRRRTKDELNKEVR